jgi:hypothetical protein
MHGRAVVTRAGLLTWSVACAANGCGSGDTADTATGGSTTESTVASDATPTTSTATTAGADATDTTAGTASASGTTTTTTTTPTSTSTGPVDPVTTEPDDTTTTTTTEPDTTTAADTTTTTDGSACADLERCEPEYLGFDDDCDGEVDEACACLPGQAHFCFLGDPALRGTPGCDDGTARCTEGGAWGPCVGGFHAVPPDDCFVDHSSGPHNIYTVPFRAIDLATGLGEFGQDAIPDSESWVVTCPSGVDPCPVVTLPSTYLPLQSGEYPVHYSKQVAAIGLVEADYALIVGVRGLRVELSWEHPVDKPDVDLHLHRPGTTTPWAALEVCSWKNCTASDASFGVAPTWFADPPVAPPTPVNWWLDPVFEANNCYFIPRGVGQQWQALAQGCHNPRLDLDNATCDPAETDLESASFCAPENINIDFPPEATWTRIGAHYYNSVNQTHDIHPRVKIFCDGSLAAELGPAGYYEPESPVTFSPADAGARFWLVADVRIDNGPYGSYCTVQPLHADPANRTPLFTTLQAVEAGFTPAYPP